MEGGREGGAQLVHLGGQLHAPLVAFLKVQSLVEVMKAPHVVRLLDWVHSDGLLELRERPQRVDFGGFVEVVVKKDIHRLQRYLKQPDHTVDAEACYI